MLPGRIQHRLHVGHSAGDGEHGALVRHHDAELAEGTVAPVGTMPAAPELVAVPLRPVAGLARAVGDLLTGRLRHPLLGHELAPFPLALLQIELAEPRDVLRLDAEAPSPFIDAARAALPGRVLDAERIKEARVQVRQ